ncbi:FAD-dependent oxidoreductase [Xinfangfangia sp. CPCC 101601]|uniref:FAD-dependent oxidoreductase n=1 Tax=Pseudogemmobacter lacusdianii TaxID=3069608 RepID=A0ABU0VX38_9RHOB|nr:FAD-dependent oxidoreductase [Xinfangfangia sp. CPCC 101601]MDQ2066336.1 FAD-dependent oxidoreductase [Xinfangfangia sp. CPCC 101601]
MPRNPRYNTLFEPVQIGPKVAPNRFFQVPHASGMTNVSPRVRAAFRGMKAEGGWGVVCTGACSVDPSSDDSPFPNATLWDKADIKAHRLMTDAVHAHGALAGVELWHGGAAAMNRTTRFAPLSPSGVPWMATHVGFMTSARPKVMDAQDIRDLIRWHAEAAKRSEEAGFDILYVYSGMGYLPYQFLLSDYNHRTDAYGGSVQNRVRLTEELIDAVRDATGGRCAVALRISMQELRSRPSEVAESEAHEVMSYLKDAPDLFDVKMDYSAFDCAPSRYSAEGSHEQTIEFMKKVTTKPVVGVGRFTSPDTMVSMVKRGVLDLIGGARPSIADPFLPAKINEGREEDIRECIGCNICISSWHDGVWVRCTQNPTVGEEYRRGWHPEKVTKDSAGSVLVIGGGPAGLEAALTLARRGFEVSLAEARREFGGRLLWESSLPGLRQWFRVADYRLGQLAKLPNVTLYPESPLTAAEAMEFGADHIVVATGADWDRALCGPNEIPEGRLEGAAVYTPTDLAAGRIPQGPVLVHDFDNYYMGSAVSEWLSGKGLEVTHVTTAGNAAAWGFMTNEQPQVHKSFAAKGITLRTAERVTGFDGGVVRLAHMLSETPSEVAAASVVLVGTRVSRSSLAEELRALGAISVHLAGDAFAPGALAHVTYSAHKTAREISAKPLIKRDFAIPSLELQA